eukprot:m.261461 g.261461  ORF g.261461 m.261461 type:complete len:394 (-) comp17598_c0_seq10:602-1783(-)
MHPSASGNDSDNADNHGVMATKHSFYQRVLPTPPCTSLQSEEGQVLFQRALVAGHLKCFFPLIGQFTTQDEPAYCGLASLVMVLNALGIDPGTKWKGPWRWYHESMLDCCQSLEVIQQKGITFDEALCLARCNHTLVPYVVRPEPDSAKGLETFRKHVVASCTSNNSFIIASYSRKALGQTGDGHFTPIGGYDAETDQVLLLDVARFKYPCHWVALSLVYTAMAEYVDKSTGKQRGYFCMERPINEAYLFAINQDHPYALQSQADPALDGPSTWSTLAGLVQWNSSIRCCARDLCLPEHVIRQMEALLDQARETPLWTHVLELEVSADVDPTCGKCACIEEIKVDWEALGRVQVLIAGLLKGKGDGLDPLRYNLIERERVGLQGQLDALSSIE